MAALRLGGLSSGLDTETILAQLMAAERGPRLRLEARQQVVEGRKATLDDIAAKLRALQTAVADVRSPTLFAPVQAIATTDETRLSATSTGMVAAGSYSVEVTGLARAEQRTYTYTSRADATDITVDGVATAIPGGATLAQAIAAINGDPGAKVYASDLGGALALSWRATGAAAGDDVVSGESLTGATVRRTGLDASILVDGETFSSPTNSFSAAIPGMDLTVKATTPAGSPLTVTVSAPTTDAKRITEKVKAFVDAYNAANDLMRNELREERVRDAATRTDRAKGALRGDAGISGLQAQLRRVLSETVATGSAAMDQLADLGISSGASSGATTPSKDAVNGKLVLDEAKLKTALAADPLRAEQLLGGRGAGGIAQRLDALLTPVLGTGGSLDVRGQGADAEVKRLKDAMTAFDQRLELREKALRAVFTRMEQSLQGSSSQGSFLGAQLNALRG